MQSGVPPGNANAFLPAYAASDFKHDFQSSEITLNTLNRIEIPGSRSSLIPKLNTEILKGKTSESAYAAFGEYFSTTIPAAGAAADEDSLLESVTGGVYSRVMTGLSASPAYFANPPEMVSILGTFPRTYQVLQCIEKTDVPLPTGGAQRTYIQLLSCLWAVSGGTAPERKTKFVIMYDAGYSKTTQIANLDAAPSITDAFPGALGADMFNKGAGYEVYFLNSSENMSDPATKIMPGSLDGISPNVKCYFLTDSDQVRNYPLYTAETAAVPESFLYSNYALTTNRSETRREIRATLTFPDGSVPLQIENLKTESEADAATAKAVELRLSGASPYKFMSPFLLKRAGDWCQALCLLDKTRVYSVLNNENKGGDGGDQKTLQQLEDEGAEIMIMTHDRVLLSYALTLGLNVLYTSNRGGNHWVVYWKNMDRFRIDDGLELYAKVNDLLNNLGSVKAQIENDGGFIASAKATLGALPWDDPTLFFNNVSAARLLYYKIANLNTKTIDDYIKSLSVIKASVETNISQDPANPQTLLNLLTALLAGRQLQLQQIPAAVQPYAMRISNDLSSLRNMVPLVTAAYTHAKTLIDTPTYPEIDHDQELAVIFKEVLERGLNFRMPQKIVALGGKDVNPSVIAALVAERLANDINTASTMADFENFVRIPEEGVFEPLGFPRRTVVAYKVLFEVFRKTFKMKGVSVSQSGGGYAFPEIAVGFYILTRVPLLVDGPGGSDFKLGEFIRSTDGQYASIVDTYFMDSSNYSGLIGILNTYFNSAIAAPIPWYVIVMFYRLVFLKIDMLFNKVLQVASAYKEVLVDGIADDETTRRELYGCDLDIATLDLIISRVEKSDVISAFMFVLAPPVQALPPIADISSALARIHGEVARLFGKLNGLYAPVKAYVDKFAEIEALATTVVNETPFFVVVNDDLTYVAVPYAPGQVTIMKDSYVLLHNGVYYLKLGTNVYVVQNPQPAPITQLFAGGKTRRRKQRKNKRRSARNKRRATYRKRK